MGMSPAVPRPARGALGARPSSAGQRWWQAAGAPGAGAPAPQGSAVAFGALMAFIIVSLTAPQSFVPALAPFRLALLTGASAVVALFVDAFVRHRPLLTRSREIWVAACLAIWATVSVVFSYWPGGSVNFLLGFYFKTIAIFWLVGATVTTVGRLRQVAWALSLMAAPLAASAVKEYLSGSFFRGRIVGFDAPLTGNPNDLALMLNLILPLTLALVVLQRRAIVRRFLLVVVFLDVTAIILTLSRAGFLTLATTFGLYAWTFARRLGWSWVLGAAIFAVLCFSVVPHGYWDRVGTITDINADPTGSAQNRWSDTVAAARYVLENPVVGAGVGMNALALNQERGPTWMVVHNVFLEYATELGIPGLVLFLMLLVASLKSAGSVQRLAAGVPGLEEVFYLAQGVRASLVAFVVSAFFYPVGYHFYFYYFAGLAIALRAVFLTDADVQRARQASARAAEVLTG